MKQAKKTIKSVLAVCAASFLSVAGAEESADEYPVGVSVLPVSCMEMPGTDAGVSFFRLNLLAGCNRTMTGFDFGTVGNWTTENAYCLAFAAGYNVCGGDGGGVQLACVNFTEKAYGGLQLGLGNMTWGLAGLQLGVVNATGEGCGVQLGLVNLAESFSGLQLGLLNMNQASALMMMPIVNVWF